MSDEVLNTVTLAEAKKLIGAVKGKKTFALMARSFMPTSEDRGFEGSACISVTQVQFRKALDSMLAGPFAEKGARLRIWVSAPAFEGSPTRFACY